MDTSHLVKQLQFVNWLDHGTPASADDFIKFVPYVRKSHQTGPILAHCSAGIGRTGVLLCGDVVFCAVENSCVSARAQPTPGAAGREPLRLPWKPGSRPSPPLLKAAHVSFGYLVLKLVASYLIATNLRFPGAGL